MVLSSSEFLLAIVVLLLAVWIISGFLWKFARDFFHDNYSFFDVSFLVAYFVEQISLIVLLTFYPEMITFWVSIFALLVVTTSSLQKLSMDSRDRKLFELNAMQISTIDERNEFLGDLLSENEGLKQHNEKLSDILRGLQKK